MPLPEDADFCLRQAAWSCGGSTRNSTIRSSWICRCAAPASKFADRVDMHAAANGRW